jgi:ferritin-like metal-binding protein YciE
MKNDTLKDLLILKVKALYDIENQIIRALPKMAKKATNPVLRDGFKRHLNQTKIHASRLEKIFKIFGAKPQKTKVEGIRGLAKDADWVMKNIRDKKALDANLIAAAQYVEHYEMAGYGSAREWAKEIGETEVADLLEQTLKEEKMTDEKLNQLAMSQVNPAAA